MIKQKVRFGYNMPEGSDAGTDIMWRVNFYGPEYEKCKAASEALGLNVAETFPKMGLSEDEANEVFFVYFSFEIEAPQAAIN